VAAYGVLGPDRSEDPVQGISFGPLGATYSMLPSLLNRRLSTALYRRTGWRYFPEVADEMADRAWEAAASRTWAGLHYVIDDVALAMGRQVGRLICSLPAADPLDDA
jgi:hypothetical protein